MKKIVSLFLTLLIILVGAFSITQWASAKDDLVPVSRNVDLHKLEKYAQSTKGNTAKRLPIKEKMQKIKNDRANLIVLEKQINQRNNLLRKQLQELKNNPKTLSQNQMQFLHSSVQQIKDAREGLRNSIGGISSEQKNLAAARGKEDPTVLLSSLTKLQDLQQQRFDKMSLLSDQLNKMITLLKSL